ncbi:MAG: helix-turn-helix transcriptional regulator [Sandaracinus sp.]
MTRAAPLAVVEKAYALDPPWDAWLRGMADAAASDLAAGMGLIGVAYDARIPGTPQRLALVATEEAFPYLGALGAIAPTADPSVMREVLAEPGLASLTDVFGAERFASIEAFRAPGEQYGLRDFVRLNVTDATGVGVMIGAPQPRATKTRRDRRRAWAHVYPHVAAALRLRLALLAAAESEPAPDAVLDAEGKLVHAENDQAASAREELRRTVVARRDALESGRAELLDPWTALVEGRWSLVDRFERDGRHYVVARANEPDVVDPRALAPRERQVAVLASLGRSNKAIAYELGIATSRVGTLLGQAARKLGASGRADLVALVRSLRGR